MMSFSAIAALIGSIATIVGGLIYLVKFTDYKFTKTPDEKNQDIDQQEQENRHKAEETGRPV
jgi:hypothetical protein